MSKDNAANERIRSFVVEKFPLARKRNIKDSDELLESGIMDSLGILDLVAFIESEFNITVSDEDLSPENFSSIENVARFAERRNGKINA